MKNLLIKWIFIYECLNKYNPDINLSSLNIGIDTSNGAASKVSEYIYSKLDVKCCHERKG